MAKVYSISGKVKGEMKLPKVFASPYRPDLIQRSVVAEMSRLRQSFGTDPSAGLRTSADYFGSRRNSYRQTINKGISRLPREKTGGGSLGKVRMVPQSVGGHRPHTSKVRDWAKKINKKEWTQALNSAIAATSDPKIVEKRGHKIGKLKELPIVVEDAIQAVNKTSDVVKMLQAIDLKQELERCSAGGRGILIVVGEDKGVGKAAVNIPGVEVAAVGNLDVRTLAPGACAGRMTLWSESALRSLGENGSA